MGANDDMRQAVISAVFPVIADRMGWHKRIDEHPVKNTNFAADVADAALTQVEGHERAAVASALEEAWKAAFRACRHPGAGYKDENSRLLQRAENEMRLEVARAIRALRFKYDQGIVRPLEWSGVGRWCDQEARYAESSFGVFQIVDHRPHGNGFQYYTPWDADGGGVSYDSWEEAQVAAQNEYERCVLKALASAVASEEQNEAKT
jgi:hypothetical protein